MTIFDKKRLGNSYFGRLKFKNREKNYIGIYSVLENILYLQRFTS